MTEQTPTLPLELELAFEPLHKRAFGMALGVASGLVFFLMTAVVLVRRPDPAPDISILREYFYGYTVSWPGAFVALAWGFIVGFVAGWFTAFCRNLVIAVSLWVTRTRAELDASRDFLDHI
jgi:ribose/xylose/arabinose/galactoside ABC-type transport system permease subunit